MHITRIYFLYIFHHSQYINDNVVKKLTERQILERKRGDIQDVILILS